ncbi:MULTISPECIES: RadC family protein [Sphingobacterium]|uniref:DNA repair protein RadC n=1 Tax=Sphingobacterium populi TaxID=1812824 RepID=A0ABW5U8P4_9SPHI|nr:DNA repair protein RadC [Sphingobacterium sp. CFCC 11742]
MKLAIHEWAESDRPREKLIEQGRRALSNAELLAILIGSGSPQESAVELCRRVLSGVENNLSLLSKLDVADLCRYHGIGQAKAITIIAALEIGRRRKDTLEMPSSVLNSSKRVFNFFRERLQDLPHEEFWVLYLNTGCKLIDKQLISRGGNDFAPVDIRIILKYALQANAHSMILIHNHPSGTLSPSLADKQLTKRIADAAVLMDIRVNDHIIFTDQAYYSFRDEGLL